MITYRITRCHNSDAIAAAVTANGGYCPCKVNKDETTKCMCLEFREQFMGECGCGLYNKIPADYVIFTREGCPRCDILKKELDRVGKVYVESTEYPEEVSQLPVLMTPSGELYNFKEALELFPRRR